jgi:hypothetical protein
MARQAIHPGEHLAEQFEALEMSAATAACKLRGNLPGTRSSPADARVKYITHLSCPRARRLHGDSA